MFYLPLEPVLLFILVFMRVIFFFSLIPLFGDVFVPARIRVLLAVGTAIVYAPLADFPADAFPETIPQFLAFMVPEALLGAAFGLVGRILFAAAQFAGHVAGQELGFQMASQVDPSNPLGIPMMAQLYYIVTILVFFLTDAHHVFFLALARSFEAAPPGFVFDWGGLAELFQSLTSRMFVLGLQLSLPILVVGFAVMAAMGMISKGVPQVHVFIESFPLRIIAGFAFLALSSGFIVQGLIRLGGFVQEDLVALLRLVAP